MSIIVEPKCVKLTVKFAHANLTVTNCKFNLAFPALVELYQLTVERVASHIFLKVHYDAVMRCRFRLLRGYIQKSFRRLGD